MFHIESIMSALVWVILGLLFFVAQIGTGLFDLVFPGIAALFAGLLSAVIPELPLWALIPAWIAGSFLGVFFFRRGFKKLAKGELIVKGTHEHAGEKAVVLERISPQTPGRISFHGTSWTGISLDDTLEPGEQVYILDHDNMNFVVSRHFLDEKPEDLPLASSKPRLPDKK